MLGNLKEEKERVESCSAKAHYAAGVMEVATSYCGEIFKRFMKMGGVLELGPAEGVMTDRLFPHFSADYTVVDGAEPFVASLCERHRGLKGYAMLFEEFEPGRQYENIILGHVLEHVQDPVTILKKCAGWLTESGRILAAVPNANSIHRQAAVQMGLLAATNELNETDYKNGHRRVYDFQGLQMDFLKAGLKLVKSGGYWLKPVSNAQIDMDWNKDMIEAFMILGEKYPEIAGEIYVVAGV